MLVKTSRINLVLGKIFCRCQEGAQEPCARQGGALELCVPKVRLVGPNIEKLSYGATCGMSQP